jgi:thiamine-phosphate pyrophosphorylase
MPFPKGIYLVADTGLLPDRAQLLNVIRLALAGGIASVQLRAKALSLAQFTALAREVQGLTQAAGIPLIINDAWEVALAIGADGLHIGQGDLPYQEARACLGNTAIIGLSVEHLNQVEQAFYPGLDYVAASPVFSTPTKTDTAPALGVKGLSFLVDHSPIPVVAIGGINLTNVGEIARYGGHAAAVVSAICAADDPLSATRDLVNTFNAAKIEVGLA